MKEYVLDAENKVLGRIASEAAAILRGKKTSGFVSNMIPDVKLKIININKIKITGRKINQKKYKRYSGYPGGLKLIAMNKILQTKGMEDIFKKAVMGMLSRNKLRKHIMKNLIIDYGEK